MDAISKVQRIIDAANGSESVGRMMNGWNRTVQLRFEGAAVEIAIESGAIFLRTEPVDAAVISFTLTEETLDALMAEKITPLVAKLQGKIRSSGNIIDILRFSSILSASLKHLSPSNGGASEQ